MNRYHLKWPRESNKFILNQTFHLINLKQLFREMLCQKISQTIVGAKIMNIPRDL